MTPEQAREAMLKAAALGLNRLAIATQGRAAPLAPIETGDLRSSLVVSEATPGQLASSVSSDLPYAVAQHEDLAMHHSDGQAKFLETATNQTASQAQQIMAGAVREVLEQ